MRISDWSSDVCSSDLRVPIADDEAAEPHPILEHAGDEALVARHLDAVPTRKAGHHRLHAGIDRGDIGQAVDIAPFGLADRRIALLVAVLRDPVGKEMLGRGAYVRALEAVGRAGLALAATDETAHT